MMRKRMGAWVTAVLLLVPLAVRAELTEASEAKIRDALRSFETSLVLKTRSLNERAVGKTLSPLGRIKAKADVRSIDPSRDYEVAYSEADLYQMAKEDHEQRLRDLEKYERLLVEIGADPERLAGIRARIARLQEEWRHARAEYNRRVRTADGRSTLHPEHQTQARQFRTELLRHAVQHIPSATSGMTEQEVVEFLKRLAGSHRFSARLIAPLDVNLTFGPDYHIQDFTNALRERVVDVLADWGTREAWSAIMEIAGRENPGTSSEIAAVQHLLGELGSEKARAFREKQGSFPLIDQLWKAHGERPQRFRKGVKYVDVLDPQAAPLEFQSIGESPEFRGSEAKRRFFPLDEVRSDRRGLAEAASSVKPANRWARLARRFRTLAEPRKVSPVVQGPAENAAAPSPGTALIPYQPQLPAVISPSPAAADEGSATRQEGRGLGSGIAGWLERLRARLTGGAPSCPKGLSQVAPPERPTE